MCKSLHRMTEDVYLVEWILYLNYLTRTAEKLWTNDLRNKIRNVSSGFPKDPTTLIWDAISSWIKGFSMSPVGKKKASKRRKEKEKTVMLIFSAPGLDLFTQAPKTTKQHPHQIGGSPAKSCQSEALCLGHTDFCSPCPRAIRACRDGHRAFCFRLLQQLAAKWQANEDNPLQALISSQSADDSSKHKDTYGRRGGSLGPFYC